MKDRNKKNTFDLNNDISNDNSNDYLDEYLKEPINYTWRKNTFYKLEPRRRVLAYTPSDITNNLEFRIIDSEFLEVCKDVLFYKDLDYPLIDDNFFTINIKTQNICQV